MKRVLQALILIFIQDQVVTINTTFTLHNTTTTTAAPDIKNEPHKAEGHGPTIVENSFRSNPSKLCKVLKKMIILKNDFHFYRFRLGDLFTQYLVHHFGCGHQHVLPFCTQFRFNQRHGDVSVSLWRLR